MSSYDDRRAKVRLGPDRRRSRPGRMLICFYREGGRLAWYDEDADPMCVFPLRADQVPERLRHAAAEIAPDWWRAARDGGGNAGGEPLPD